MKPEPMYDRMAVALWVLLILLPALAVATRLIGRDRMFIWRNKLHPARH